MLPQGQTLSAEDVQQRVEDAIDDFLNNDNYLLLNDVNERTISSHLSMYLSNLFDGWDVDVEYNRNLDDRKWLQILEDDGINIAGIIPVYPDIIVHERGTNDRNLLVIEIKKKGCSTSEIEYDLMKLRAFKQSPTYHYEYGIFIMFSVGPNQAGLEDINWV